MLTTITNVENFKQYESRLFHYEIYWISFCLLVVFDYSWFIKLSPFFFTLVLTLNKKRFQSKDVIQKQWKSIDTKM